MPHEASPPIRCSLGIMAYNEEANIGRLLDAVLAQRARVASLTEIIIIASGCTDGTEAAVRTRCGRDARVRLIVQPTRQGKASAVNAFLAEAREKVLLLCSADLLPGEGTIDAVIAPFAEEEVAMTTCRPVPLNDPNTFMGFAAHLLWNLHHEVNLRSFKAGELIAFRKIFDRIPRRSAVDEASIESVVRSQGYTTRYVPDALTYNRGPETLRDFLSQRRRIYAGHLGVRNLVGYRVSTFSGLKILGLLLKRLDWRPRQFIWTWAVVALEAFARLLGRIDYGQRRDHAIWEMAGTTKVLAPPPTRSEVRRASHATLEVEADGAVPPAAGPQRDVAR